MGNAFIRTSALRTGLAERTTARGALSSMAPGPGEPGRSGGGATAAAIHPPLAPSPELGIEHPWQELGIVVPAAAGFRAFFRGFLKAAALLFGVVAVLLLSGLSQWQGQVTAGQLLNAIALLLGAGFAEELLFRGWLWGELELLGGRQRAIGLQAAIFALVHPWYQLPAIEAIGLLIGLALLGLALALQRRADQGALWGSVGLHGGLVGGWFALQAGLISVPASGPAWLLGPGGSNPNPIGGLLGWAGLAGLILVRRRWWR